MTAIIQNRQSWATSFRGWVMLRNLAWVCSALLLTGCTFVSMTPRSAQVRVLANAPSGCESRGEVVVTMTHRLGPYERNALRVRDELEILARNQAASLGANRANPMQEPRDGRQRWAMWRCPH